MPTFTIPGTTPDTAEVTMRIDSGDVHIAINGVDVVFFNAEDGDLCLFTLDDEDRRKVGSAGMTLDGRHIKVWKG